ncbi:LuxR family transcriptional regulator [Saccharopolyspora rhizosphaerae]|uniref:LuxR family transcriptional regulator n=1 Tax=Saccharopolyspora rhizosphaerae TaxID=2492662 RepID=A0A3R8P7G6_9PSEU|nr:AAA family ATPase [Saccharopolyspora rhizosphaerae]RRO18269.1 LuxR family transcriptional regulator [Saccharopolyspora rhizosphaerae]
MSGESGGNALRGSELVGRDAELAQLLGLVGRVAGGRGTVLRIEGEPGIGKTTLVCALLTEADRLGCAVHHATADPLSQQVPLRVLLDCIAVHPAPGGAGVHERVRAARDDDQVPAAAEQLLALIEDLCATRPVVLTVDDVQWADETSLLVWNRLSRMTERLPLLLVAAGPSDGRTELGVVHDEDRKVRIVVPPLDESATADLAAHLIGTAEIGPSLLAVLTRAAGNPRYVREVVLALSREHHLEGAAARAELAGSDLTCGTLPRPVAEALTSRLDFVGSDTLGLLRTASLFGATFSVTDLRTVSERPVPVLVGCVEEALASGLLVESGSRLAFQHELIRQALHVTTPPALRLALHQQAARALASSGAPVERVGEQLLASVPGEGAEIDEWGVDWLVENGRALAHRDPVLAEALLGAVPVLSAHDPRRDSLRTARVLALVQLGLHDEARASGERALEDTQNPSCAAELSWYLTWSLASLGRDELAAEVAEKSLRSGIFDHGWSARTRAALGRVLLSHGHVEAAEAAVEGVVAEARGADDGVALGLALHVRGTALARRCDPAGAVVCHEQAGSALGEAPENADLRLAVLDDRRALLFELGRPEEAEDVLHEMLAILERCTTPPRLAAVRLSAAHHHYTTGRWHDATAELEAATELADRLDEAGRRRLHGLSAVLAGHRGDRAVLCRTLREAGCDEAPTARSAETLLVAEAMLAEDDEEPERAVRLLSETLTSGERIGTRHLWLPHLVRLAVATGATEVAGRAADACSEDAAVAASPGVVAASQHCRGLLERESTTLRAAVDFYRTTDQGPRCARAWEDLAVVLAERGERAQARDTYAQATTIYRSLGAAGDLRRADPRVRPQGARPARSRRRRAGSGWTSLTPTERQIARLVADGLANPDIAEALVSSRRTVEVHVSHILAKLGARSRVEIAVEATRHDLRDGSRSA